MLNDTKKWKKRDGLYGGMGNSPYLIRNKLSYASLITAKKLKHLAAIRYLADRTWHDEINRRAYVKTCAGVGECVLKSAILSMSVRVSIARIVLRIQYAYSPTRSTDFFAKPESQKGKWSGFNLYEVNESLSRRDMSWIAG